MACSETPYIQIGGDLEDACQSLPSPMMMQRQMSEVERRLTEVEVEKRLTELSRPLSIDDSDPTLADLTWPPDRDAYAANVLAGLVSGLKIVLGMVTFANIVFNSTHNPSINGLFTTGINLNMMAACVGLVSSAIFSDMNALVSPQDVPSIVLGQLSPVIAHGVREEEMAGPTLLAAGWISTLLTGVFLLLLGRFHASGILRKLPSSVVGGFIAAMGATGIRSSLSMISGAPFYILWPTNLTSFHESKTWVHLGLAFYSLVSIRYLGGWIKPFLKSKQMQALASPFCLLSPILVFYAGLAIRGDYFQDLAWMQKEGWIYPPSESRAFYTMWSESFRFDLIDWNLLLEPSMASSIVVLSGLTSLSAVLSIVGTAPVVPCASNLGGLGGSVNLDKELVVLGAGQAIAGALTGLPGYQQVALSANMYIFGGTHRLAEFVCTGFVMLVMVSGVSVASFVPKFFLGAVFLNLGMSFCKTHLVDNWGVMDTASYCSMLLIVFMGLWKGLTQAVAVGIIIEAILTIRQASNINPVYQCGGFDGGFISSRVRTKEDASRLRWRHTPNSITGKMEVLRLQGPLFFGNAPTLEDEVKALLRALPTLTHFAIDMTRVTQVDDSGARALSSIFKAAGAAGVERFAIAGARPAVRTQFERYLDAHVQVFDTLDHVLELYEDELLGHYVDPDVWQKPSTLSDEHWEILKGDCSRKVELEDGDCLFEFGSKADGLWLLVRGSVTMETRRAGTGTRMDQVSSKYVAPSIIGNSNFLMGAKRHAFRIRGQGSHGATLLQLTEESIDELREKQPSVYIALVKDVAGYWMAVEANHLRWRCAVNQ